MQNMGSVDRIVRAIVGVVLVAGVFGLGWGGAGLWFWVLSVLGIVMLLTAAVGVCPAYMPFGIRTCPRS